MFLQAFIKKIRTKRLYYKILVFFICLVLLFAAVQICLYQSYYAKIFRDELENTLSVQLDFIQKSIDSELKLEDQISTQILWSENINRALTTQTSDMSAYTLQMTDTVNYLKSIQISQELSSDIWIYSQKEGTMIGNQGTCDSRFFFDHYWINGQPVHLESTQEELTLLGEYVLDFSSKISSGVAFCRKISSLKFGDQAGWIFVNIHREAFDNIFLHNNLGYPLVAFMFDENLHPLLSYATGGLSAGELSAQIPAELLAQPNIGLKEVEIGEETYLMQSHQTSAHGIRYCLLVPQKHIAGMVAVERNSSLLIALFCLCLGAFLSLFFTRKLYSPIEEIVDLLKKASGEPVGKMNELGYIEQKIKHLGSENSALQDFTLRSVFMMKETFFRDLFAGGGANLSRRARHLGIQLEYPCYQMILLQTGQSADDPALQEKHLDLCLTIESLILPPHGLQCHGYCCFFGYSRLLVVLNATTNYSEIDYIHPLVAEILKKAQKDFDPHFFAILGRFCTSQAQLPAAWGEVISAARDAEAAPGSILHVEEAQKKARSGGYSIEREKSLLGALCLGNVEEVRRQLDNIFADAGQTSRSMTDLCYQLAGTVSRALQSSDYSADWLRENQLLDLNLQLEAQANDQERKELLQKVFAALALSHAREKSNQKQIVYQQICHFVQEHFAQDLSLQFTGAQLGYSPSYVSWIFKEASGENFIDYVHRLRIARAKELLIQTVLPIFEIASQVGYASPNTFIKRFKKEEGVTPGQFRETLRKTDVSAP